MRAVGTILFAACLAPAGCSRADGGAPSPTPAATGPIQTAPDPHADGKAIAAERVRWKANWKVLPELPSCAELELGADEKALCTKAADSRAALRAAEEADADPSRVLDAALAVALTSTAAWNALRTRGISWMITDLEARDGGRPRDLHDHGHDDHAGAAPSASVGSKRHPLPGTGHVAADPNPWSGHVKAYLATAGAGMARIAGFLRLAPVPVRRLALERLEKFVRAYPESRTGIDAINDAYFGEQDPDIRARLGTLRAAFLDRTKKKRR